MKQINFHLALYPDTFLWINEQKGIFYNTREHSTFLFDITKLAIIGEIWKSRAKLLRNRIFEKIASVTG